jgi:hypothetical protein
MESKNETVRRNVLKLQQRMAKFIETSMAGPAVATLDTTDESK